MHRRSNLRPTIIIRNGFPKTQITRRFLLVVLGTSFNRKYMSGRQAGQPHRSSFESFWPFPLHHLHQARLTGKSISMLSVYGFHRPNCFLASGNQSRTILAHCSFQVYPKSLLGEERRIRCNSLLPATRMLLCIETMARRQKRRRLSRQVPYK